MIDITMLAPALALGVYVTVAVLPLLALLWLTHGGFGWVSRVDARLRGSVGGTLVGMWLGLAIALIGGAISSRVMLWALGVAVPLLACAGAAAGIRAATVLPARHAISSHLASAESHAATDRHEAA